MRAKTSRPLKSGGNTSANSLRKFGFRECKSGTANIVLCLRAAGVFAPILFAISSFSQGFLHTESISKMGSPLVVIFTQVHSATGSKPCLGKKPVLEFVIKSNMAELFVTQNATKPLALRWELKGMLESRSPMSERVATVR